MVRVPGGGVIGMLKLSEHCLFFSHCDGLLVVGVMVSQ